MFYNQPLSIRFGTELLKHIDSKTGIEPFWDSLDIAVAWVRATGMAYLSDALARFLGHGGQLCFIVGIDLQNTSKEGLQALLDLEAHGASETYVYHNEAGSVFHPKLYLFRNEEEARLIVGSNNLTAAGLYTNVEAGLQLDTKLTDNVIVDAVDALASWRDTSTDLAVRLDQPFLNLLYSEGYVKDEANTRPPKRSGTKPGGGAAAKLFGTRSYSAPAKPAVTTTGAATVASSTQPTSTAQPTAAAPMGTVVLMRLRKARGTQTQIPFRVAGTFLKGVTNVVSAQSGVTHGINPAQAHGNPNTIKLEIPELRHHTDTYARFEKTSAGVVYEVHDIGTPKGNQIKAILDAGFSTGDTQTSISDASRATWWRYI
ncbi:MULTISPECIES: phospholipase D-like domain-containing protein [Salipiger]|uniref:phospholipase D-like domain-containing protein n=1 Tax=Salipiger TaxID=263377 RepID=UPI0009777661|nr:MULTISPECIES: phospholipase D family protein [Salipiger]GGA29012.1 hypothetical protein GCM10011326_46250 [Salipiger profundus]